MESSVAHFLTGAGQFLLVAAIAFAGYCLLISHLRFESLAERAAQGDIPTPQAARGAEAVIGARIAASSRPFALLLLQVQGAGGAELADQDLRRLDQALRLRVRESDRAALADAATLLVLLEAPGAHGPAVLRRLTDALAQEKTGQPPGLGGRVEVRGALAHFPADRKRPAELMALARERLAGGDVPAPGAEPALTQAHTDGQTPAQASKLVDPLTGVLRTEFLNASMQKYLARLRETGQRFALLYADVDHLRRYNDQYGRTRADRILRAVSDYLQRSVREGDLIGRGYGGDEFAIGMPVGGDKALAIARRLVLTLRRAEKDTQMDGLRVGISIGVAHWPEHGATARHVLESARIAMKQAKSRGRGVVVMAEGPAPAETLTDEPRDVL